MSNQVVHHVEVTPVDSVRGAIRVPGSKSLTNRALVCAAIAVGESQLEGALDCEDTEVMVQAWRDLGLGVDWDKSRSEIDITGCGGRIPNDSSELFIGNSGTTMRFLTAVLSACTGRYVLDGIPRMRQRPIADLLDGIRQLGGTAISLNPDDEQCPPVEVRGQGLAGGKASVRGSISSQFLSGLLMAAPLAKANVELAIEGALVSKPYVDMTLRCMKDFGIRIPDSFEERVTIEANQVYQATRYAIEPDASAASYFLAAAAITGGDVTVDGVGSTSIQGDSQFCRVLEQMGCVVVQNENGTQVRGQTLRGIDVDLSDMSDMVQTLAVVALFADGTTRIRGVGHNRFKESDRISDLARELRKLGAKVEEFEDGLSIEPGRLQSARIETYNDHRMAMAFSLAGLRRSGIQISNPSCTAKTFPKYFECLSQLSGAQLRWMNG